MTRLGYLFLGTYAFLLTCFLLFKQSSTRSEHDVLVSYASSCFGVFTLNSAKLSHTAREIPMTLILAAVSSDDIVNSRADFGLCDGDSHIIYVADQPSPENGLPENKGNEALPYLTYLIDNYENLPEVMVFMHGHRSSWHNNALLRRSSPRTVNRLRPEAVLQRGYVNLACDEALRRVVEPVPGAAGPSVLDLTREEWEADDGGQSLAGQPAMKQHERYTALWEELFPEEHHPAPPSRWDYFAGGQFAVSREVVELIPRGRLRYLQDWILHTRLSSKSAGAVFEALWEAVFFQGEVGNGTSLTPTECYCDLYGMCPGNARFPSERVEALLDAATLMMGHLLDS